MEKLGYSRDTQKLIYAIMNDISNFFTGQDAGRVAYNIDLEQTKKQLKERFLEVYDMQPLKSPLAFFSKYLEKNMEFYIIMIMWLALVDINLMMGEF